MEVPLHQPGSSSLLPSTVEVSLVATNACSITPPQTLCMDGNGSSLLDGSLHQCDHPPAPSPEIKRTLDQDILESKRMQTSLIPATSGPGCDSDNSHFNAFPVSQVGEDSRKTGVVDLLDSLGSELVVGGPMPVQSSQANNLGGDSLHFSPQVCNLSSSPTNHEPLELITNSCLRKLPSIQRHVDEDPSAASSCAITRVPPTSPYLSCSTSPDVSLSDSSEESCTYTTFAGPPDLPTHTSSTGVNTNSDCPVRSQLESESYPTNDNLPDISSQTAFRLSHPLLASESSSSSGTVGSACAVFDSLPTCVPAESTGGPSVERTANSHVPEGHARFSQNAVGDMREVLVDPGAFINRSSEEGPPCVGTAPCMELATLHPTGTEPGSTETLQPSESGLDPSLSGTPPSVSEPQFDPALLVGSYLGQQAPLWVPDSTVSACMSCQSAFSLIRRRHHCRACGKIFCGSCCHHRVPMLYLGSRPERVCNICLWILLSRENVSAQLSSAPSMAHAPPSYNESTTVGDFLPPDYHDALNGSSSHYGRGVRSQRNRNRTNSNSSVVIRFDSAITGLPPVIINNNSVVRIDNSVDINSVLGTVYEPHGSITFLLNMNLVLKCGLIKLGKQQQRLCWYFISDGMGGVNQDDVILILDHNDDSLNILKDICKLFNDIFEHAKSVAPLNDLDFLPIKSPLLSRYDIVGLLLLRASAQAIEMVPGATSYNFVAYLILQSEVAYARVFPIRLLLRIGYEYKEFPCPLYNDLSRRVFYSTFCKTVLRILADFQFFRYSVPRDNGIVIHVSPSRIVVRLCIRRKDEIRSLFQSVDGNVLSIAGHLSKKVYGHLVCLEQADGSLRTEIFPSERDTFGSSFLLFSGIIRGGNGVDRYKMNIVEDGVLVNVTPHVLKEIKSALCEQTNYKINVTDGSDRGIQKIWFRWKHSDPSRISQHQRSPIDGVWLSSLECMKIRHAHDFTASEQMARLVWTDLFFFTEPSSFRLVKETGQVLSAVSKVLMTTLTPHLNLLYHLGVNLIALRVNLDPDNIFFKIATNHQSLPQELELEIDHRLIPVVHTVAISAAVQCSVELLFHVMRVA